MATIYLVRHAPHAHVGETLSGRMPGLPLTPEGVRLADALAERFAGLAVGAVQSSPLERTRQTAGAIADRLEVAPETVDALTEIDFGEWTGRSFAALADDAGWRHWNEQRSIACPPGGESMAAAQARVVDHLYRSAEDPAGEPVVMVTHCDIIRGAVAHVLGLPLEAVHRFEVAPASITQIAIGNGGARLVSLNERVS